jgi:uncharacterized protein
MGGELMKNGGPEYKRIAEHGQILRVRTGSVVHGISTESSDRDEVGVCIPPPEYVLGLRKFEQYQYRDAAERTGKFDAPSKPGDLDLTVYSLQKFVHLALNGNPSMIELLFTPPGHVLYDWAIGRDLMQLYPHIVSMEAAPRYLGYLMAQRRSMMSNNGKGRDVTRPQLVAKYGFDTKYAGHMIRLGMQGVELIQTGRITLPMDPKQASIILGIRQGQYSLDWCLLYAASLEEQIKALTHAKLIPDHPDREAMDRWLIAAHMEHWEKKGLV